MFKYLIVSTLSCLALPMAIACPDISGEYSYEEHPWNGKIIIKQNSCDSIEIKHLWPAEYPDPNSKIQEFNEFYKTNGKFYEGMYESGALATREDRFFHATKFTETGFAIIDYTGSQKKCGSQYTYNYKEGCKITETRLEYNKKINKYVWRIIGKAWFPEGWSDDTFPLKKK
jgi:hypothetical protein